MSFNVTVEERPRMFSVKIGYHEVGTVKSHNYKNNTDGDDELYMACRTDKSAEDGKVCLGWFSTMDDAVRTIIEYSYGSSKVTKTIERPV
jgi:hypothetical protein